jgi:hypothetical protein
MRRAVLSAAQHGMSRLAGLLPVVIPPQDPDPALAGPAAGLVAAADELLAATAAALSAGTRGPAPARARLQWLRLSEVVQVTRARLDPNAHDDARGGEGLSAGSAAGRKRRGGGGAGIDGGESLEDVLLAALSPTAGPESGPAGPAARGSSGDSEDSDGFEGGGCDDDDDDDDDGYFAVRKRGRGVVGGAREEQEEEATLVINFR